MVVVRDVTVVVVVGWVVDGWGGLGMVVVVVVLVLVVLVVVGVGVGVGLCGFGLTGLARLTAGSTMVVLVCNGGFMHTICFVYSCVLFPLLIVMHPVDVMAVNASITNFISILRLRNGC